MIAPEWLAGCKLRDIWFQPTFHKHVGQLNNGIHIHAEGPWYDPAAFRPWRVQALGFKAIRSLWTDYPIWRGKDFKYTLVYPDGTSKVLLSVPRFDFGWQLTYVFKEEVAAPKGSRLDVVAHHDNSPKNKFNPDPTKEVRWGDQTWDEMMIGYLDYTIDKQDLRKKQPQAASSTGQ